MTREIRKEQDFWDKEREVIYENDKQVGEIRHETTAFGPITVEYDNNNHKVSETRTGTDAFGESVERTYDPNGQLISETRHEKTAILGEPIDRTYAPDGSLISETSFHITALGERVKRVVLIPRPEVETGRGNDDAGYVHFSRSSTAKALWRVYLWASGALWLAYFAVFGLHAVGGITPETIAALGRWLESTVQTPLGIALMLFFSVGLAVTGYVIVAYVLAIAFTILVPVMIVALVVSVSLKAEQPWPVVGVASGIAVLVVYFRWLARRA